MIAVLIRFTLTPVGELAVLLHPPGCGWLLSDDDFVQELRGFSEAFFGREQAVFMLDGEDAVVAEHPERGDKLFPPLCAMTIAAGAEDPPAIALVGVWLGVEYPGERQIGGIELGVFGVDVKDGVAEKANGCDGIDSLPEHVAWVVVAANRRPR
jgi:hypothetical protein